MIRSPGGGQRRIDGYMGSRFVAFVACYASSLFRACAAQTASLSSSSSSSLEMLDRCLTETSTLFATNSVLNARTTARSGVPSEWTIVDGLSDENIVATRRTYDWSLNSNSNALAEYRSICSTAGGAVVELDTTYHCTSFSDASYTMPTAVHFIENHNGPLCLGTSCSSEQYQQAAVVQSVIQAEERKLQAAGRGGDFWLCFGGMVPAAAAADFVLGCYTATTVLEDYDSGIVTALQSGGPPATAGTTDFTDVTTASHFVTAVDFADIATTLRAPCEAAQGTATAIDSVEAHCVKTVNNTTPPSSSPSSSNDILLSVHFIISNIPRCIHSSCSSTADFDLHEWISTEALMANEVLVDDSRGASMWTCSLGVPPACYADENGLYGSNSSESALEVNFQYELELLSSTSLDDAMTAMERVFSATVLVHLMPETCGNGNPSTIGAVRGLSTFPPDVVKSTGCRAASSNTCYTVSANMTVFFDTISSASAVESAIFSSLRAQQDFTFAHADIVRVKLLLLLEGEDSGISGIFNRFRDTTYDYWDTFLQDYWWAGIVAGLFLALFCCCYCKWRNNPRNKLKRLHRKQQREADKVLKTQLKMIDD